MGTCAAHEKHVNLLVDAGRSQHAADTALASSFDRCHACQQFSSRNATRDSLCLNIPVVSVHQGQSTATALLSGFEQMKTTSSFPGVANGDASQRPLSDEKMEQVRQLLFGDFEKQTEGRVRELEARVRELELGLHRRLDALQARLEALAGEVEANQRTSHHEIAAGLSDLADRVRRISGA